jgi:hypothetical protein
MPVERESHLCARVHIRHPWVCSDECMSAACSLVHWCMTPRHCSRSGVRLRPPYGISPTSVCRHLVLWYNNTVGRFASGYLLSQSRRLADPRVTAIRVAHSCCRSNTGTSSHLSSPEQYMQDGHPGMQSVDTMRRNLVPGYRSASVSSAAPSNWHGSSLHST